MSPDRNAEQLAALIVAAGVLSSTAAALADNGAAQHATRLIDRTPMRLVSGKESGCGKCGANACGESYWDKRRMKHHSAKRIQKHSHGSVRKRSKSTR